MPDIDKIVAKNIDIIRNNMSYRRFSKAIYEKTGVKIGVATLQQYITAVRKPKSDKLEVLAKYADKPIIWFYQDHSKDNCSEENQETNKKYSSKCDMLPKEILELKAEYLALAKEIQDARISPDEIKLMIHTIKTLKKEEHK